MLDVNEDIVLLCRLHQLLVVVQQLDGRLGDENVNASLDRVQSYGIVRGVGSENGDCNTLVLS